MTRLSVNVNKVATLRNARGGDRPNLLQTTKAIIAFGAQGITVHPRPDERHIKRIDVFTLKENISVDLNIEGYPSEDYLQLIEEIRPEQSTLVPDPPHVLTSNAGWKVRQNLTFLQEKIQQLKKSGSKVSLFIDPLDYLNHRNEWIEDPESILKTQTHRIELYTEQYARLFSQGEAQSIIPLYKALGEYCYKNGVEVNAGHDLDAQNLPYFLQNLPFLHEVSIGHAIISDALHDGLEKTLKSYLRALQSTP